LFTQQGCDDIVLQAVRISRPVPGNKLSQCDSLARLPPADGLLIVDAHPAIAVNAY
jgi:hypothetical protein